MCMRACVVRDVMRSLGEAGVIEKEMTAILLDQQIDDVEFSPEVEACLPKTLPWKLPEVSVGVSVFEMSCFHVEG